MLLFSATYLWIATNRILALDGRGLGWFSLFVSVTAASVAIQNLWVAETALSVWLAVNWGVWSGLWFLYFLLLTMNRSIQRPTAFATLGSGIATGWLLAMLLLNGVT